MKIRLLHRSPELYTQTTSGQQRPNFRSHDIRLHPFVHEREYQRALVAVKMDKIFAKPLVAVFDGHRDTVNSIARCNTTVYDFFTGASDGELRFWNAGKKQCTRSVARAHEGMIEGICVSANDKYVFTCGRDKKIKQWPVEKYFDVLTTTDDVVDDTGNLAKASEDHIDMPLSREIQPAQTFLANSVLTDVDHHSEHGFLVSTGESVCIWDTHRSAPLHQLQWGSEQYYSARWSPSEPNLFLASAGDNTVCLFDMRQAEGLEKMMFNMRVNATCWNPTIPFNFTVANEDSNLYTFDMRKLQKALRIHHGFVNAAMDVDYSPTGLDIVAGSFDHTIRIWREHEAKSREIYHTKRMQIVTATRFSGDGKFVLSGSGDMNVRVWKTDASEILGPLSPAEFAAVKYRAKLKEKFASYKEISKIANRRQVPGFIKRHTTLRAQASTKESEKEQRRRAHGDPTASNKTLKELVIRSTETTVQKK